MDVISVHIVRGCRWLICIVGGSLIAMPLLVSGSMDWLIFGNPTLISQITGAFLAVSGGIALTTGFGELLKVCALSLIGGSILTFIMFMDAANLVLTSGSDNLHSTMLTVFLLAQPVSLLFLSLVSWVGATKLTK